MIPDLPCIVHYFCGERELKGRNTIRELCDETESVTRGTPATSLISAVASVITTTAGELVQWWMAAVTIHRGLVNQTSQCHPELKFHLHLN